MVYKCGAATEVQQEGLCAWFGGATAVVEGVLMQGCNRYATGPTLHWGLHWRVHPRLQQAATASQAATGCNRIGGFLFIQLPTSLMRFPKRGPRRDCRPCTGQILVKARAARSHTVGCSHPLDAGLASASLASLSPTRVHQDRSPPLGAAADSDAADWPQPEGALRGRLPA